MAKAQSDAVWQELDVETLPAVLQTSYEVYKEAAREAAKLREAFEGEMREALGDAIPQGRKMVFGYRFGKLSFALVEDDAKPKAAGKIGLGDFLKAQQASGRRS